MTPPTDDRALRRLAAMLATEAPDDLDTDDDCTPAYCESEADECDE